VEFPSTRRDSLRHGAAAGGGAQSLVGSAKPARMRQWFALRRRKLIAEFLGYDTEEAEGKIVADF